MRAIRPLLLTAVVVLMTSAPPTAAAPQQAACQPPSPPPATQPNIFTEEQENDLGDAIAESMAPQLRIINNDPLTAELKRVGDRLARHLPPTRLKLQFILVDLPELNAFVLPGGRIYVSRKLIGFTRDEDELAGVLGHEMGHLVARQQTQSMTRLFRDVISVTQVGDRKDIFEKYNRLMDNANRRPEAFQRGASHEDKDQVEADRIGLFVVAASGYDPQAHARLFDRFTETKGNTGGFFSDLFGTTSLESKRLREMLRTTSALPQSCVEARPATAAEAYRQWQASVIAFTPTGRTETLHNVESRTVLQPGLRGDVTHARFSPDGRYLLAQDDSGITVLSREPLATLFRIPSGEAENARFSGDSQLVTFHTPSLRVEIWNIAARKMQSAHDVVVRKSCWQTSLAPDGKTLACLDWDFNLNLINVASNSVLVQRKAFYAPNPLLFYFQYLAMLLGDTDAIGDHPIAMDFSGDGKYFAAGFRSPGLAEYEIGPEEAVMLYNVAAEAPVPLKGPAKRLLVSGFAFLGNDRIVGFNAADPKKSGMISLPSGDVTATFPLNGNRLEGATKGDFVFIRPYQKYAVVVTDLAKAMIVKGSPNPAIDIYGDAFVAERNTGELAIYNVADNQIKAVTTLPPAGLGRLRATAVSSDFKYVAVSGHSRGGVWALGSGERIFYMRGFRGALFDKDFSFFADFPKAAAEPRRMVKFDPATKSATGLGEIKDQSAAQHGPYLLVRSPLEQGGNILERMKIELRDSRTGTQLWSRNFSKEPPEVFVDPEQRNVVFVWPASAATARDEARKTPALAKQLSSLKEKEGDYLIQVLDAATGQPRGGLFVETGKGSFRLRDVTVAKDAVVAVDNSNRVLVYSLSTGTQIGRAFGNDTAVGAETGLLSVENASGQLTLYDLATMMKKDEFTFSSYVAYSVFSPDGKKLFVLTGNQTAYVLDVSK